MMNEKRDSIHRFYRYKNMSRHRFSAEEIANCRRFLLAWYDINKRKLPWRDWHDIDTNIVAYRGLKKRR